MLDGLFWYFSAKKTPNESSQRAAPASDGALGVAGEPEQAVTGSVSAGSVLLDAEEEWDDIAEGSVGGDKVRKKTRMLCVHSGSLRAVSFAVLYHILMS